MGITLNIKILRLLSGLLMGALSVTGLAAVTAVSTSPTTVHVALGTNASVTLAWTVNTNTAGIVSLTSSQGEFRSPTAVLLGNDNRSLSKTVTGPTTAVINEIVLVPAAVIYQAHKLGLSRINYERSFNDGGGALNGQLVLHIVSPAAADFSLSRLQLGFSDGKPYRLVARHAKLMPQAALHFTGNGVMQAQWEVAGPNPVGNEPAYHSLKSVQRAVSGGDALTLTGPKLPSDVSGQYLVRLRVTSPEPGFDLPVIRYFVGQDKP